MSVRNIINELEARLAGNSGGLFSKPSGKLERKSYGDGVERLKVSIRNLKVPDQSVAVIKTDGVEIAQINIINGAGRLDRETQDPGSMPILKSGQTIYVTINEKQVLSGKIYKD